MKVLFYADIHVSCVHRDYSKFLDATMAYLESLVKEHKPDILVNLGDTLDTFGTLDVRDGVKAAEYLQRLSDALPPGSEHVILRGNHDTADKEGKLSSAELVVPATSLYFSTMTVARVKGYPFLILPHTKDFPACEQIIANEIGKVSAVFAHTDWIGCRLTPAYVSKDGLDPAVVSEHHVQIFAGHYHAPLDVGAVHFVGAPLYHDFRDLVTEKPRGFTLLEGAKITRIPNPHTYNCHKLEIKTKKELQKALDRLLPEADKSRVKVYVPKKLMQEAEELFRGFLWSAVYPLETEREGVEFAAQVTLKTTPEDAVKKAASSAGEEFDKPLLEKFGLSLFRSEA